MPTAEFLSKANIYDCEFVCDLRTPANEMYSRMHYHDFYEFVVYLGNAGTFHVNDEAYRVNRGDIVLIDIFTPHTLTIGTNYYERFCISIDPALLIEFSTPSSNLLDVFNKSGKHYRIFHVENSEFDKYLTLLADYRNARSKSGHDLIEKALVHLLLSYIYSDCFTEAHHSGTDSNHLSIVAQLISYISEHLSEEFSLEVLSQQVNYSQAYVCRLFKQLTGKTLTSYVQEKRIAQAAFLLQSGASSYEAAERVGFNNYSYFYKTFKKLKGCSPAEYKLRTVNEPDAPTIS